MFDLKATPFLFVSVVLLLFPLAHPLVGKTFDITVEPYSARGDGETDNRNALVKALADAQSGDVVFVPAGNYRIELTKSGLTVPSGVTVLGQGDQSVLQLASDGGEASHREFLRFGSNATLDGLVIERAAAFPAVLFPIFGDRENVTIRDCRIVGHADRFGSRYCHAIQVGNGTLRNLTLENIEITTCSYGLFQANEATGTVDGVTVVNSRFSKNTASDLEFNSPRGTMQNITVRDCLFSDNQCRTPSAGFAVGFAKVTNGRVENCLIRNTSSESLHVEDHSTDIVLAGNTIVGGSAIQNNGVIMVLSSSQNVTITNNIVDARQNTNRPHLILVTAGGGQFKNPSDVKVIGNCLVHGPETRTWYLQPGSGPKPEGNVVVEVAKSE